jgi:cell division protein FtsI (penicillin-binding protein 3)
MSVHDPHAWDRAAPRPAAAPFGAARPRIPSWRWLTEAMWWVEHAFGRARADARPEEDTRVRIFVILAVFSLVFAALAVGAAHAALFTPRGGGGSAAHPNAVRRADLVDRNGALLAINITYYGLYIDPAEVWDRRLAAIRIKRALPRVSMARLNRVLNGDRRLIVMPGLKPAEKAAVHALALGGVTFEPEDRRVYPLGPSATHVIGDADTGGRASPGPNWPSTTRSAPPASAARPSPCRSTCASRACWRTSWPPPRWRPRPRARWASSPTPPPAKSSAWPAGRPPTG